MGSAIAARHEGDDYQARWFWIQACRMFEERAKVVAVEYEARKPDAFDDVAVYYGGDMRDEDRYPLQAEYYQTKFHVRGNGCVTYEALTKPEFINAERYSILEHLKAAQRLAAPDGRGALFYFYTVWVIDPQFLSSAKCTVPGWRGTCTRANDFGTIVLP